MSELKVCPQGHKAIGVSFKPASIDGEFFGGHYCFCGDCQWRGPFADTREKAIELWNRRTAPNVVLPFKPHKGKTLIDVTEFVEHHPHPDWYEVGGSEVTISFSENGEPTFTLDCTDYTAEDFGTVIFESEAEAWAALEEESG